jgi:hypothetical protein
MKDFMSCIEVFDILHYTFNAFFESPSFKIPFRAKWNKLPEAILYSTYLSRNYGAGDTITTRRNYARQVEFIRYTQVIRHHNVRN